MSGTDPEKTLLLVDGSSLPVPRLPRAARAAEPEDGEPTGAIHGMLNMLREARHGLHGADDAPACSTPRARPSATTSYPRVQGERAARCPTTCAPDRADPRGGARARLAGADGRRRRGRRRDRHAREQARAARLAHASSPPATRTWRSSSTTRHAWINTMTNEKLDVAGVTAKFGVPPERIVDYLTLIGDASTTSRASTRSARRPRAKWLQQYGSLDGVIAHADEIRARVGENLRKALDWLPQGARAAHGEARLRAARRASSSSPSSSARSGRPTAARDSTSARLQDAGCSELEARGAAARGGPRGAAAARSPTRPVPARAASSATTRRSSTRTRSSAGCARSRRADSSARHRDDERSTR